MKFIVPIHYAGICNFVVEAKNSEEAKEFAKNRFYLGEVPELLGNEAEEIVKVGDVELASHTLLEGDLS